MATFTVVPRRVVNWDFNEADVGEEPVATPVLLPSPSVAVPATAETSSLRLGQTDRSLVAEPRSNRVRPSRNGHRSEMVRKLNDDERAWLRTKFLQKNGQIANDDCVAFKGQIISDCIAIFQITGYVSVLHRYVALGRLELRDLPAYLNWMHEKYRGLWSQYNNERFTAARRTNQVDRVNGRQPTVNIPIAEVPIQTSAGVLSTVPTFKVFPRRAQYARASA
jgi:hypothetical protein